MRDRLDRSMAEASSSRRDCEALRHALLTVETKLVEYQQKDAEVGLISYFHRQSEVFLLPYYHHIFILFFFI